MAFLPRDAAELAAHEGAAVVASGPEPGVLVARTAWQPEVMQPVKPAEGPFALAQPAREALAA